MVYYLYNTSTDTDKAINDIGLFVPFEEYITIDSNDINGWMLDSSDLYTAIQNGLVAGAGDRGLILYDGLPGGAGTPYSVTEGTKRLSLSKEASIVMFDNSSANLPGSPANVQDAIEAIDTRVDTLEGTNWREHCRYRVLAIGGTGASTYGSQKWGFSVAKVVGDPSGLANDATTYTCTIAVDGGTPQAIEIVGSASQTFQTVIDEINVDLVDAVVSWESVGNGFIKVISDLNGTLSTIAIVDTDLFGTLTNALGAAETAIDGTNPAAPINPDTNDYWVDITEDPDEYKKWDGSDWGLVGNVADEDRVIKLDDDAGTYLDRIFVYDSVGDSWSVTANNADNDTIIIDNDGDGNAAMYTFDTALTQAEDTDVKVVGDGAAFDVADLTDCWYFTLDSSAPVQYYVWIQVDGTGDDPAVGGKTGIEVDVVTADTNAQIATKIATALNAYSAGAVFDATADGQYVQVINDVDGDATDATNGTCAALLTIATIVDGGDGDWFKIADIDWGSPTLQTVYDGGDNDIAMSSGSGDVDWELHDGGSWQVSTGALYIKVTRAGGNLNWLVSSSTIDWDATTIDLDSTNGTDFADSNGGHLSLANDGTVVLESTGGNTTVKSTANAILQTTGGGANEVQITSNGTGTGAITIETTGAGGDIDIDSNDDITVDAGGLISLDAADNSNFTVAGANLTLSTTSSGNVVVNAAGNVDVDGTAITLDATAASNFTVDNADLTLQTTTAGDINVTAKAGIEFTAEDGTVLWTDGTNIWTPEHEGLRAKNYTTVGLPGTPGTTSNYGAIAFDTTLDRLVIWVTDSDGVGTDGWISLTTEEDEEEFEENLDEAYDAYGGTSAVPVLALITVDAGNVEWRLTPTVSTFDPAKFLITDGTNNFLEIGSGTDDNDYITLKSRYDDSSGTGSGTLINDHNVQAGGTGGGVSLTTSATAGTPGDIVLTSADAIDINATNGITVDGTAISIDGTAGSNFTVTGADLTLKTITTGDVVIAAVDDVDMDATNVLIDASTGFSIDGNAASNVSVDSANLTLSTTTSGNVVINAVANIDADAVNVTIDASSGVSIDAAAASNFTVDSADLTISTTTSGDIDIASVGDIDADAVNVEVDASSTISLDAAAASNFTVAANKLTLSTTSSGDVDIIAAGDLDADATNVTIDASSAFDITGNAASSVVVDSANLTLQTTTSGDIKVTSKAGLEFTAEDNTILWTDGTTVWKPEHEGLRLKNYNTGGLPATPGATTNYGAVCFNTTLDAPMVWVTDADGGGTDGWSELLTATTAGIDDLNDAYDNFGANAALIIIDNGEGQGDVEWRLAANTDSMKVTDGAVTIVEWTKDNTAGAADGRVDIGNTAILGLPARATAPSANNAAGDMFYDTSDGLVYQYDGVRSKWLTTFKQTMQWGSRSGDGQYLHMNGAQAAQTGFLMPRDGTITSVTVISSGGLATKGFEIRRNNNSIAPLKSFNLVASKYTDASTNVDFSSGDYLQVFTVSTGAPALNIVCIAEICYRQ